MHMKELDNMKIALEILKKEKATEKHNTEHVLSMKVEMMKLESSIDELNTEKEHFRTLTKELENKNEKDTRENQNLRRSSQDLIAKIEDLTFLNKTLREERDVLTSRNDTVVANIAIATLQCDRLEDEQRHPEIREREASISA